MPYPELLLAWWVRGGEWEVRIDGPHLNPPLGQRHVHIRRRRGRNGEYSWNLDGTRHDKGNFPKNEQEIGAAKRIAADRLKVDASTLQLMCDAQSPVHIVIIDAVCSVHEFVHGSMPRLVVLANDDWLILVEFGNETEPSKTDRGNG